MKRTAVFLTLLVLVGLLSGCGEQAEPETESLAGIMETEASVHSTEEISGEDAMLEGSLVSEGNNYRLQKVLNKISSGEEVTVGFIGGSITEGYNAKGVGCYAELVTRYLDEIYSDGSGKVSCLNAGLSGTPSMLGLIRADADLLEKEPDLIFIEFAVNDAQSFTDKQAYEALIRKCLLQENEPAVVLLYSVTSNGYTCQNDMALTGFYYDLPGVSVRDAIMPAIQSGSMTWADYSNDDVHPHSRGHQFYCRLIAHLIDTLASQPADPVYEVPTACKFSRDWSEMKEYDGRNLTVTEQGDFIQTAAHPRFSNGFSYRGESSGEHRGLTFTVTASTVFLVYKASNSGTYGTAEVLVNGEVAAHLTGYDPNGWNNPVTQLILSQKESAPYEITIRMQPGDEDKCFDLLAVGIVDN